MDCYERGCQLTEAGAGEERLLLLALGQVRLRLGLRRFGISQETRYINNKQYTRRQ